MFRMESQIAQTEYAAFVAKFNRPAAEGATVTVPNIIDRAIASLRRFTRPMGRQQTGSVMIRRAMPAK